MNKRELFSSFSSKKEKEHFLRPSYYKNEDDFLQCEECEDKNCIKACEESIIEIDKNGSPKLNFNESGCTYCDECAISCEMDILKIEYKKNIDVKVEIDLLKCLSWNQTMCFSCKDPCLDDAIEFLGMFRPEINQDKCTNCGFCVGVCPTDAINIISNQY